MHAPHDKRQLSESDICDKYIRPAMERAGWNGLDQIYREYPLRAGRVVYRAHRRAPGTSPVPAWLRPASAGLSAKAPRSAGVSTGSAPRAAITAVATPATTTASGPPTTIHIMPTRHQGAWPLQGNVGYKDRCAVTFSEQGRTQRE